MIRAGVMSYWSRNNSNLVNDITFTHLCMWGLAATHLIKRFPKTILFCDGPVKKMLIDDLHLPFTDVREELYDLTHREIEEPLWALGKMKAYHLMKEPFLHIDGDVFLNKNLSNEILNTPIISESSTSFVLDDLPMREGAYQPRYYKTNLRYLPGDLKASLDREYHKAGCFGLFGGVNYEAINEAADKCFSITSHPDNLEPFKRFPRDGLCASSAIEEYMMATALQTANQDMDYLIQDNMPKEDRVNTGYVHLIGANKRNAHKQLIFRIDLLNFNPKLYKRIEGYAKDNKMLFS